MEGPEGTQNCNAPHPAQAVTSLMESSHLQAAAGAMLRSAIANVIRIAVVKPVI